ncbi:hypothetical protein [Paracoccus marinaquae]|uniref:Flagellar basal body-associated protein FliL n=1 Tax=Paracoccus marinaquae TaxID=2841926 RepID=A0ABS6AKS9_9RHOB|nr:hypothetical protein [Paracoccus marinaquae]MBU3031185.1 hypothetical protein [Paracoccus marinaquae]
MKKILTLILPVLALVGGIAGGEFLRPADEAASEVAASGASEGHDPKSEPDPGDAGPPDTQQAETGSAAWFTFPAQFFVPLMRNGDMGAVMILTLSIETTEDQLEAMKQQEHRLRDALLRQLMIQANTGGFDGNFTAEASTRVLREQLLRAVREATALPVSRVLIEDIARQAG